MSNRSALRILALGLMALVLMLGYQMKMSYEAALKRATDDAENLAFTLDGQISATLRRIEASLTNIAGQLPDAALDSAAVPIFHDRVTGILTPFAEKFPEISGFFVWDAQGNLLYDTISSSQTTDHRPQTTERRNISERPGFQELKNNPLATFAFSDSIRSIMTGRQTVAVYVPLRDARGRFKGVVTATLNLDHFGQVFKLLQLGRDSVVFIRRSDNHKMVIRYPLKDSEINKTVRNPIQEHIDAGETAGRDRFQAVTDGTYRLYGFRKQESFPFYVVVGISQKEALGSWYKNAAYVSVGIVLMVLTLGIVLIRMRRVERQKQAAQHEANKAHQLLQEAVQSISSGFTIFDENDRLVICNEAYREMYNTSRDLIVPGATFEDLVRKGAERGQYGAAIGPVDAWVAARVRLHQGADGRQLEQVLGDGRCVLVIEHQTPSGFIVGNRVDITERKRLEAELRELATTDTLTGLPNRRHFLGRLDEELERIRRLTTRDACVLMLDLDHFKRINDVYGHAAGDTVLRHFASILREQLRLTDTGGRLGGEEFAIILSATGVEAAQGFAERLCQKLAEMPVTVDGQTVFVTASIGIAAISRTDATSDSVLMRADAALYQAKECGRNRVIIHCAA